MTDSIPQVLSNSRLGPITRLGWYHKFVWSGCLSLVPKRTTPRVRGTSLSLTHTQHAHAYKRNDIAAHNNEDQCQFQSVCGPTV